MYNDGLAALVLVSGEKARNLGLQVLTRIRGYADVAQVNLTYLFINLFGETNVILAHCSC